jgi:hypothetical protein
VIFELDDVQFEDSFVRFFETHNYLVRRLAPRWVEVQPLNPVGERSDRDGARRDLEAWIAWNPGAGARLIKELPRGASVRPSH